MDKRKRNPDNPFAFTDREYELLQITCAGLTTVEASAMALRISPRTVRTMRTSMIAKVALAIPGTQDFMGVILAAVNHDAARAQCFPMIASLETGQLEHAVYLLRTIGDAMPKLDAWMDRIRQATTRASIERNTARATNPAGILSKAAFEAIYLSQDETR